MPGRQMRPNGVPELPLGTLALGGSNSFSALPGKGGSGGAAGGSSSLPWEGSAAITAPGNPGGPPHSSRTVHSAGEATDRTLDGEPTSMEVNFYQHNRILHPWDLTASTPDVLTYARAGRIFEHVDRSALQVSSSTSSLGGAGAGGSSTSVAPQHSRGGHHNLRNSSSNGYHYSAGQSNLAPSPSRRPTDMDGVPLQLSSSVNSPGTTPYVSRPSTVPRLVLHGSSSSASPFPPPPPPAAAHVPSNHQTQHTAQHLSPLQGQAHDAYSHVNGGAAAAGVAWVSSAGEGGTSAQAIPEPKRRSFELDPLPGGSQGQAAPKPRYNSTPMANRAASVNSMLAEQKQQQQDGVESEGQGQGQGSSTAPNGRPPSQPARPGNGIIPLPYPSSLYGPASAALAKLPPRNSPRRSPRNSPRVMSASASLPTTPAASSSSPGPRAEAHSLQLAPHTQAAAAAAVLPSSPGPQPFLPWVSSSTSATNPPAPNGSSSYTLSEPSGPTGGPPFIPSAPVTTIGYFAPEAAPAAWQDKGAWQEGQARDRGLGKRLSDDRESGGGGGGGGRAGGGGGGGDAAGGAAGGCLTPTRALMEQERAGQAVTIEHILMTTAAAPPKGLAPAPSRPDAAAALSAQQAFRALHPRAKPPSREDVLELQAAMLREAATLLAHATDPAAGAPAQIRPSTSTTTIRQPSPRQRGQQHQQHQQQQHQGSPGAAGRHVSPPRAGTAAAAAAAEANRAAEVTVSASSWWPSTTGPPAGGAAAAVHLTAGPLPDVAPFSWDDVAFVPVLSRDAEGFILNGVVTAQETALTSAVSGVVAQVGVSCVERARLLHSVWATARAIMAALIQDRDKARSQLVEAHRAHAAAAEAANLEVDRLKHNLSVVMAHNTTLSNRDRDTSAQLAAQQAELAKLRKVVGEGELEALQSRLARLRDSHEAAQEELEMLRQQLHEMEAEMADARQDLAITATRAMHLESQAIALRDDVRARTPRPKRTLGPLGELLTESGQQSAVLAALAAGAPPQEVHRLLLGVSVSGEDLRPWASACGSCRTVVPPWTDAATHTAALAPPPDNSPAGALAALLAGGGGGRGGGRSKSRPTSACGASVVGGPESKSRPGSPTGSTTGGGVGGSSSNGRTSSVGGGLAASLRKGVSFHGRKSAAAALQQQLQAAAMAAARGQPGGGGGGAALEGSLPPVSPRMSSGMSGLLPAAAAAAAATAAAGGVTVSGAGGGGGHGGRHKVTMTAAQQSAHLKKVHAWLEELIECGDVPALSRLLPEEAVEAIAGGLQLDVCPGALAAWLLGSLTPGGFNFVPYRDLTGILATKYNHTTNELGGPVSQALESAALTTVQRVKSLEEKSQDLHREVVKLKRNLADHKRSERAKALAEAEAKERKNLNRRERPPHPVQLFIEATWADFFTGLGQGAHVPKVMRHDGRVYNRRIEKVDAEKMVNAIWDAKDEWQSKNKGARMTLADFMVGYMARKYVAPRAVTETTYNLIYTLGQHLYDPDCNLFIKCFMGEVDEGVRKEEEELLDDIVSMLTVVDRATHGKATGYLSKRDMRAALKGFFAHKKALRLEEVMEALDTDCSGETVQYRRLFDDDGDLNQGVFAETIRQQFLAERLEHLQAIEDALFDAVDRARVRYVPPSLLSSALTAAISHCNPDTVRQHMRMVYGLDSKVRQAEVAASNANRAAPPLPPPPAGTAAAAAAAAGAGAKAPAGSSVPYQPGHGGMPGTRAGGVPALPLAAVTAAAAAAAPGTARSATSGGDMAADGDGVESGLVLTPEEVMALIRRGWVQQVPSIASAIKSLGVATKLKLRLQAAVTHQPEASGNSKVVGGKALLGVLTKMRGGAASGGLAAAVAAAGGVAGDDSGTASPGGADVAAKMRRAAAKRIKYLQAMDAVRDAWLQEEKAKVVALVGQVNITALSSRSGASDGMPPDAASPRPAAPLGPLPSASEFADDDDPELAALEAAQKMLAAHQAMLTAAAGGGGGGGKGAHGVSFGGASGGGSEPSTPRLRRVSSMVAGSAAAAAAAAVDEVGERMACLRTLGGLMVALAEDRPDAPAAELDPEIRKSLYNDPAESDDEDGDEDEGASGSGGSDLLDDDDDNDVGY